MGQRCLVDSCSALGTSILSIDAGLVLVAALDGSGDRAARGQALGVVCSAHGAEISEWAEAENPRGAWCYVAELGARRFLEWRPRP